MQCALFNVLIIVIKSEKKRVGYVRDGREQILDGEAGYDKVYLLYCDARLLVVIYRRRWRLCVDFRHF